MLNLHQFSPLKSNQEFPLIRADLSKTPLKADQTCRDGLPKAAGGPEHRDTFGQVLRHFLIPNVPIRGTF